jgi:hypothetical protein
MGHVHTQIKSGIVRADEQGCYGMQFSQLLQISYLRAPPRVRQQVYPSCLPQYLGLDRDAHSSTPPAAVP